MNSDKFKMRGKLIQKETKFLTIFILGIFLHYVYTSTALKKKLLPVDCIYNTFYK